MTGNGAATNSGQGLGGTPGEGALDAGRAPVGPEAPLAGHANAEATQRAARVRVGSLRHRALTLVAAAVGTIAAIGAPACATEVKDHRDQSTHEERQDDTGTGGGARAPNTSDPPNSDDTQEAAEGELKKRYFQASFAGDTIFFTGNYPEKIVIKGFATAKEAQAEKSSSLPLMELESEGNGGDFENVPYQFNAAELSHLPAKIFLRFETSDGQKIDITNNIKEAAEDPNKIYGLNFVPTPTLK